MIYLAGPYTHPSSVIREVRYQQLTYAAGVLQSMGLKVFSPITHGHVMAQHHDLPIEFDYWREMCEHQLSACTHILILTLDGWEDSTGVSYEYDLAVERGLRIALAPFAEFL